MSGFVVETEEGWEGPAGQGESGCTQQPGIQGPRGAEEHRARGHRVPGLWAAAATELRSQADVP